MSADNDTTKFVCPHPECDKSFSRLEHLARHKLNHWPKEIFQCRYVYPEDGIRCSRTFVRRDLLVRHEKRHTSNGVRLHKRMRKEFGVEDEDQQMRRTKSEPVKVQDEEIKTKVTDVPEPRKLDHIVLDVGDSKQKLSSGSSGNMNNMQNFNANTNGNLNNFFSWLFMGNNYADPSNQSNNFRPSNDKPRENSATLWTENGMSALNHPNNSLEPNPLHPNTSVMTMNKPNVSSLPQNTNLMEDMFSVDFLPNDPLQSFVQQISYDNASTDNSTGVSPVMSNSSPSIDQACNRCNKYQDVGKIHVKDNLLAQKSKIGELKSQIERSSPNSSSRLTKKEFNKKSNDPLLSEPSFFHSDPASKYDLSLETQANLALLIADLKYVRLQDLQTALKSYWQAYHPKYPILHKPSFNVNKEPPILLLSMIMTGASFLGADQRRTISDVIAGPLRWLIFSHEDFQPTSETYIIQALLLLECYEKTSTNRYLHERSYLHHGTTIQLLRRTPSLGGHPLRTKEGLSARADESIEDIYKNWIDFETLKRTALYAFFIDTTHAVVFGYTYLFIHCNQIQLSLPCPDEIWESYDLSLQKLLENGFGSRSISFVNCIQKLLGYVMNKLQNPDAAEPWPKLSTSKFGEKLLLSGLISIMFQLQQQSEIMSSGADNPLSIQNIHWQEIISFAIDYWHQEVIEGCQGPKNCSLPSDNQQQFDEFNYLRKDNPSACQIPAYHMTQIILRIFQYDYYIYAGAPWRMNVKSGSEEYALVSERILKFSQDPMRGGMAVVYAYMFLFEVFDNGKNIICDVNIDCCLTRPNSLALTSLLIWSFNYSLYGPEVRCWLNAEDANPVLNQKLKTDYSPPETFQQHLKRMSQYLYIDKNQDVFSFHQQIKEKAQLIYTIPNTNHLAGMMIYMRDLFRPCYWDLGREFSALLDNCFERSIGRESVVCESMYDV